MLATGLDSVSANACWAIYLIHIHLIIIIIIIGFSTVGQENRYKRETGDETVDRLHHLVVQLEREKKKKKKKKNYL